VGRVAGRGYFFAALRARGAWVLFAAVMSHWLLDFVGASAGHGAGAGGSPLLRIGALEFRPRQPSIVEGGMWLLAIIVYVRATRPKGRTGVIRVLDRDPCLLTLAGTATSPGRRPVRAFRVWRPAA
jgi:hypothetical protein